MTRDSWVDLNPRNLLHIYTTQHNTLDNSAISDCDLWMNVKSGSERSEKWNTKKRFTDSARARPRRGVRKAEGLASKLLLGKN